MRSPSILLLLTATIFLGLTSALSIRKNANLAPVSTIALVDEVQEERALNLSFGFMKKIPGANALKANFAAKKAAAAAKKAEKEAAKLKLINMFKLTGERDDQLFPKFAEWFKAKIKDVDVIEALVAGGKTRKEAGGIASRYRDWISVKNNKFPLP